MLLLRCIFLVSLLSCQTFQKESTNYFYQGKIIFKQKNQTTSHPIEIYANPLQPQFRLDVLGGFSGVFLAATWNKNSGVQVLIPSQKKYANSLKAQKTSTQQAFSWIQEQLPNLYTSLIQKEPEGWSCRFQKVSQKKDSENKISKIPLRCHKDQVTFVWKYRFLKLRSFHISLREKNMNVMVDLNRKTLGYLSKDIFNIQIPNGFKKIDSFDIEFFE